MTLYEIDIFKTIMDLFENMYSKKYTIYKKKINQVIKVHFANYTGNVYRDLRGLCGEIGVQGFQNCRVYIYVCIQHE